MLTFALRRLLQAIPILFGVSLVVFGLVHIVPGNPIDMLMPPEASPEVIAAADPINGEPEVHFAAHFPGEEDIPPMKIVPFWTSAVEFLLDAGKGEALWGLPDDRTAPHPIVAEEITPPTDPVEVQDSPAG